MVVFVIGAALALLAVVQFMLAMKHDKAVAAAGPIEELATYDARLAQKKDLLVDLEEELEKRRQNIATIADVQVEVDALVRQRENLLTEWATLEEKRQEVTTVREDMEAAMVERQSLEAELSEKRQEYLTVQERLERAEQLVHQTAALTKEKEELDAIVGQLRDEGRRLQDAELRVVELQSQATELETKLALLQGRISQKESEIGEVDARVTAEREALAQSQVQLSKVTADIASQDSEVRRQKGEVSALEEKRGMLEARLAVLVEEIARKEGQASGSSNTSTGVDPLKELKEKPPVILELEKWVEHSQISEAEALKNVENRFKASGLDYPQRILRAFHTAMKVNESTQMAVLAGISGTGKSQLPRQYAAGMGIGFLQVPVQPRWDSPQDLMGFYNYIEGRFRPTDMARALWSLDPLNNSEAVSDRMMMILLDEMNLARVEYYFSDFLSRLESRPHLDLVGDFNQRKDAEIELEIPKLERSPRIFPGYNLLFAGTMNEDESTQSLSDKVVDRANILRFAAPKSIKSGKAEGSFPEMKALPQHTWNGWVRPISDIERDQDVTKKVAQMVELMKGFKSPFGHRLGRAIMAYVANYPQLEGADPIRNALADQVEMRLLPKLRGVEVDVMEPQFSALRNFVERDLGDGVLAEAISEALQHAESTGQFVWTGVTR
ncbi:chromosome segregation ATPase-like protein [Sedimentitalea sp. CY04]|uniref:Chromosome segregation ATPase-like protein n=2 Tax=Parasedimentitalea denitrificans TaxID=2211118 RepID=A0ABX0W9L6_9RHOB|nr:chromosome segregation ATPase-like protein [Sedimentitalea sp. CY04]